ncbi:MAG TPA: TlpA disulfide reductase family protein [Terriglobia bacterium]|nr:TlpA disulfide reductase family protein [Terriglobia bacterium]
MRRRQDGGSSNHFGRFALWAIGLVCAGATGLLVSQPRLHAQNQPISWSSQEKPIVQSLRGLRSLPDDSRARETRKLALDMRALPAGGHKLALANALANLSTEGDLGHETLQEVATTLAAALAEHPVPEEKGGPAEPYLELAQLVRYEHVQASVDSPEFGKAMAELEADDQKRQEADFTLTDLQGKNWTLTNLRGKVVLLNFWATWCPPCRKEMPDLESLYKQFRKQGLVILAISDEDTGKVKPFIADKDISYTVLLDPGRKVNTLFHVMGIPKTFIYDRSGKLVAESVDMRTRGQFLIMLAQAGLH